MGQPQGLDHGHRRNQHLYADARLFTNVIVIAAVFALINLPSVGVWAACGALLRNVLKDRRWLRLFNWSIGGIAGGVAVSDPARKLQLTHCFNRLPDAC